MKLPTKYYITDPEYMHLNVFKQMINCKIELFVFDRNT